MLDTTGIDMASIASSHEATDDICRESESEDSDPVGTATYSLRDNKLRLYPFARLDRDVYDRVKAAGFSWAPKQEVFVAGMWTPQREDLLVELCGDIKEEDITPAELARPAYRYEEPAWKAIEEAMNNVQVVSAPELFPTPPTLAERMVEEARIEPGMFILEPSAGTGVIADAIKAAESDTLVICVEINQSLRAGLESKGYPVASADFLQWNADVGRTFDRVLMNPPFSAEVAHVRHAFGMLKPGGRLVAIMSQGPFYRSYKADAEFRAWLDEVGGVSEPLPVGTFEASGTGVNTRLVVIEK